jgi:hypothetical protein
MPPRPKHIPHNIERTTLQKMSRTRGLTFESLQPAGKQTVAGMVAKGWIQKNPDDGTYCITPAGDATLKAIIPVKR